MHPSSFVSAVPTRDVTPANPVMQLAVRMVNVSECPSLVKAAFSTPLYGSSIFTWFLTSYFHKQNHPDSPVDSVNALSQTIAWRTTLDHFPHPRLAPTALSLVHFPAGDMSYLPHTRVRAAAVYCAQSHDSALFESMPQVYGKLHARAALAQLLLARQRPGAARSDVASALALETMAGYAPEHTLVHMSADDAPTGEVGDGQRLVFASGSSIFASCICGKCTCGVRLCAAHHMWRSGMNVLLRSATQRDEVANLYCQRDEASTLASQVLLGSCLRIMASFLQAIAGKFPPVARASMVLLRAIGACNALIAALPKTIFGPHVPAPVSIDLLAERTAAPLEDFYHVLPYVLDFLRKLHNENLRRGAASSEATKPASDSSDDDDIAPKRWMSEEHELCLATLL